MSNAVWEVVGGKKDGILVRTGKSIKSDEAEQRLSCHSFVEEVELDGERLHFRLLQGTGPESGWISLKLKGQDLVVPAKLVVKKGDAPVPDTPRMEWPAGLADRLRAVAEARLAHPESGGSLGVAGDCTLQLVVHKHDGTEAQTETLTIEIKDGQATVRQGGEGDKPKWRVTASETNLWKIWRGILDIEEAVKSYKIHIFPGISDEKEGQKLKQLLTVLLSMEGLDGLPADGVRRPVPFERGGHAVPPPQPKIEEGETAPEWLVPDGEPAKKRRILFLSIPWSGHIVHLKRIAEWFGEHPEYEVHFACMSEKAPKIGEHVTVYEARPNEVTDIFDVAQEKMRVGAMVDPRGDAANKEEEAEEAAAKDKVSAELGMDEIEEMLDENAPKLMIFLMRVLITVKPSIMIADSCFQMGMLNKMGAMFGNAKTIYINSPGIKEERMVQPDVPMPPDVVQWHLEQAMANGAGKGKNGEKEKEKAGMVDQLGANFFVDGKAPTPEEFMSFGGKVPMERISPRFRPLFDLPGFGFPMLIRLGDALAKDRPELAPIHVFPSSNWMIERQPTGKEFFACPLLPLPIPVAGKLQVGRQALRHCLDKDLLDWIFSEESTDPIVYVAFGTIVKGFKGVVRRIQQALSGGSWRVLWALPTDLQAFLPEGLPKDRWRVEGFVNQKDVLRCERVKVFLSHCGMNSTMEALATGVPMVCHPFFMDQYEWARTVRSNLRAGVEVHKFYSDADAIRGAIKEVLENPAYKANAMAVARRLRAQYESIKQVLGPSMSPKANLGPGATTIAAYILTLLKGKDPSFLHDLVHSPPHAPPPPELPAPEVPIKGPAIPGFS